MAIKPDGSRKSWPTLDSEANKDENENSQATEEQKLLERNWPGWEQVVIQEKRPTAVYLPRSLFAENADIYVFLACGSPKGWIALGEKSGYLSRDRRSFAGNLLRCEAIVFLQLVSIAAVAVMASSLLSWPVACFLSLAIYLVGSLRPYLQDVTQFWGHLDKTLAGYAIKGAATVVPNFASYRASEYIGVGEIINLDKLSGLLIHTSVFVVGLMMLAYLLLRSRELGK
ncbi:unnamed protein product [marine sediment metagenome]|uniref:Uncharacterized protein n=1 Tax=marine sediment metagenome TaxID=412755 RepID=X1GBN7_9ZZZZ